MSMQTVFFPSMLTGFVRLSCATALVLTLGACGSSDGDGGSGSGGNGNGSGNGSGTGSGGGGGSGSGTGGTDTGGGGGSDNGGSSVPAIKFFTANNGVNGRELWKTDGTSEGTVLVKNINTISPDGSSNPYQMTGLNGAFYFQANDGVHGIELWKTDGTADGTVLVKDIYPLQHDSNPHDFTALNGILYFVADDGVHGEELWKTDGTAEGTVLVKDVKNTALVGSYPSYLTVFNDAVYFTAGEGSTRHGLSNYEIWKTDGTTDGTVLVKDMKPGEKISGADGFTVYNNALYFQGNYDLWKTDGTPEGTVFVADIHPSELTEFNGVLYFAGRGGSGVELWKTDGTGTGTVQVSPASSFGFVHSQS